MMIESGHQISETYKHDDELFILTLDDWHELKRELSDLTRTTLVHYKVKDLLRKFEEKE